MVLAPDDDNDDDDDNPLPNRRVFCKNADDIGSLAPSKIRLEVSFSRVDSSLLIKILFDIISNVNSLSRARFILAFVSYDDDEGIKFYNSCILFSYGYYIHIWLKHESVASCELKGGDSRIDS